MLTAMYALVLAMQSGWSWWHLGLVAVAAFIVYLRWEMVRLREAMRVFEDRGAQKSQDMTRQNINPYVVLLFAVGCIVVSVIAALAFLLGRQYSEVRGVAGAMGLTAALMGSGVAVWFSIRARNRRLLIAALLSILPLAIWGWQIYEVMHF